MPSSKLTSKGQITLPIEIRRRLRRDWLRLSEELEDSDLHGDPAKERYRALAVAYALLNGCHVLAY